MHDRAPFRGSGFEISRGGGGGGGGNIFKVGGLNTPQAPKETRFSCGSPREVLMACTCSIRDQWINS